MWEIHKGDRGMKNLWKKVTIYFVCIVLGASLWTTEGIYVNAKTPIRKGAIPQGFKLVSDSKPMKKLTSDACGESIAWTYDKTSKTLEFSGTGAIYDTEGIDNGYGLIGSWSVWKEEANHLIIGEGITEIGYANFYEFGSLKSISFPNTLLEIGDFAFCDSFLESSVTIVFPPNLKKIGMYAFSGIGFSGLENVTLPNGLERLGSGVFSGQPIKELVIPGTIQYMDYWVLEGCSELEKLTLESGVEMLPFQMCLGCFRLKTVEIPNTVREIRENAFAGCEKLKNIKIPEGVQSIGSEAFQGTDITKITIPNTVKTLEEDVFMDCSKLKQVKLPTNLSEIKAGLFMNCKKLEQVKIPQTVTSVTLSAFWGTNVTKIVLPKNVTVLKKDVSSATKTSPKRKAGIRHLQQIVIQSSKLKKVSKGAFSGIDETCVIKVPKGKVKKYKRMIYNSGVNKKVQVKANAKTPICKGAIPRGLELATNSKSLKKLTSGACGENITWTYDKTSKTLEFSGTGAIYDTEGADDDEGPIGSWSVWKKEASHLIIGEGITEIGDANFYKFVSLKSISFPNTLTKIGDHAFCDSFHDDSISIVFPPNLKKIENCAFMADTTVAKGCKLENVTLPNGLERLGEYVFAGQSIREIVIPGTIQYMNYGVLSECSKLEKLTIESGVEMLPYQMCSGCINLKTVEMPNTVREIGGEAFAGCKKLKEIKMPEGVQRILNFAFYDSGITKITIPDTVKTLGQDVFMDCAKLKQVKLPAHLTELKSGLFMNCKKLEQVKIPQTVTSVTLSAFWGTSITKIVLPKNVTSLKKDVDPFNGDAGEWRKARMKKLRQIVIQSSKLKKVSKGAFSGIGKTCVIKVPKGNVKKYKKMIYKSGVNKKVQVKAIAKSK